jgi:hypothetical protein
MSTLLRLLGKPNISHRTWLTISKGPIREGVSFPSTEDGNKPSFRDVAFSSYLELRAMDKVQKPV